jgi:hypothetical protein
MKRLLLIFFAATLSVTLKAGIVEKTFYFNKYNIESKGAFQTVNFGNTRLAGIPGEPLLPWHEIVLMLPPGESALSMEIVEAEQTVIPGSFTLYPQQTVHPISAGNSGEFIRNEKVYLQDKIYPAGTSGQLMTQHLNGFSFALSTYTPLRYNPARKSLTYFRKVTVRITTIPDSQSRAALKNLTGDGNIRARIKSFAMNQEMINDYPQTESPASDYGYLVIAPATFKNEFQPLITMYAGLGIAVRVITTDSIANSMTGFDLQEKIRKFIISQYQNHGIGYVLLAGNPPLVPCRGFYCSVLSGGTIYSDSNIPADIYYSGLDGNYDANGNHIYGELTDNADLLPDLPVGRFTVNDTAELHHMIRKTIAYQTNPVLGEFSMPLLAGEFLYNDPPTYGSDYMNLLIDNHTDNGYYTHGIPAATNDIETLYDTPAWNWSASQLLERINSGKSVIHHLGHANTTYMMRLSMSAITNANFSQVNGIKHNFPFLYTQGCYDGAFDASCIAAKSVSIENFLVAGIFNSRYGWFDEGTTEGPSQHLEREFISKVYTDTLPDKHLGTAHMISKIKTAPWISLPGEFEPGAQLWCHYCCNVFGDPALEIRTEDPTSFTAITWTGIVDGDWNNPGNWNLLKVPTTLFDVIIPDTPNDPVITTINATFCHNLTIQGGGNLVINPGKSMVVYGTVTMSGD